MAFTEFCVRNGGSNLNAGTRTGNSTEPGTSADFTYASGTWVSSTGVFTVASGNPSTDGVAVGDFASVYSDGATVTTLVGRVTAVSSTTITVSTTAKSGTTTDGTSNRTLKIGGAWAGPSGSVKFPFSFITSSLTDSSSNSPRVNLKNTVTYSITGALGPGTSQVWWEGYGSTYGDGSRATIDGGSSGSSYYLYDASSGGGTVLKNLIWKNNGASGSMGLVGLYSGSLAIGCVFSNSRGEGLFLSSSHAIECEVYSCGAANVTGGGIYVAGAGTLTRCIVSGCTGSNISGVYLTTSNGARLSNCVLTGCGAGVNVASGSNGAVVIDSCDIYNSTADGIKAATSTMLLLDISSCNFVKNGAYGINLSGGKRFGRITKCGFGTGSQANSSGNTNALDNAAESGSVSYASGVTPWQDPANGDFRVALTAAKNSGNGTFTQSQSGQSGTVGYPDIGAAQHYETASVWTPRAMTGGFTA